MWFSLNALHYTNIGAGVSDAGPDEKQAHFNSNLLLKPLDHLLSLG